MQPPWTPRPIISSMFKEFESNYDEGDGSVAFLQLPTGYGKSTITLALASHIIHNGILGRSVIHVLPLRSIITDLSDRLYSWFPQADLNPTKIATQHMGASGSPYFAKPVVVTTLDTFALNYYKLPAVEVGKAIRSANSSFRSATAHFEVPRGFIYSSIVVFDEVHLFALDPGSYKQMFTILIRTLIQLACSGVPLFIITATLPTRIRQYIQECFRNSHVTYVDRIYSRGDDSEFENKKGRRNIVTSILSSDEEALNIIRKNRSKRVLVIVNEVSRAIKFYTEVKSHNCSLLHGMMVEKERKENIEKFKELNKLNKSWLLIGTQVVEAGVDVSSDILITDLAPMDRLVQRAGRVARQGEGSRGELYVINYQSRVYLVDDLKKSMEVLDKKGALIDWTLDAQEIVDQAYSTLDVSNLMDGNLCRLLQEIDESLMYGATDMKDILDILGSFPREVQLIKAYAPQYFNIKTSTFETGGYLGLESSKALAAVRNSKKVIKDGQIVTLDESMLRSITKCNEKRSSINLGNMLAAEDYDGILLDRYNVGIGYI
jgi:CRISPR-associated endonuclease/helicase Cas3